MSSPESPDKGEESETGERFRSLLKGLLSVPLEKVKAEEQRAKAARRKRDGPPDT